MDIFSSLYKAQLLRENYHNSENHNVYQWNGSATKKERLGGLLHIRYDIATNTSFFDKWENNPDNEIEYIDVEKIPTCSSGAVSSLSASKIEYLVAYPDLFDVKGKLINKEKTIIERKKRAEKVRFPYYKNKLNNFINSKNLGEHLLYKGLKAFWDNSEEIKKAYLSVESVFGDNSKKNKKTIGIVLHYVDENGIYGPKKFHEDEYIKESYKENYIKSQSSFDGICAVTGEKTGIARKSTVDIMGAGVSSSFKKAHMSYGQNNKYAYISIDADDRISSILDFFETNRSNFIRIPYSSGKNVSEYGILMFAAPYEITKKETEDYSVFETIISNVLNVYTSDKINEDSLQATKDDKSIASAIAGYIKGNNTINFDILEDINIVFSIVKKQSKGRTSWDRMYIKKAKEAFESFQQFFYEMSTTWKGEKYTPSIKPFLQKKISKKEQFSIKPVVELLNYDCLQEMIYAFIDKNYNYPQRYLISILSELNQRGGMTYELDKKYGYMRKYINDNKINQYRFRHQICFIKAALIRNYGMEVPMTLDETNNNEAYLLGRSYALMKYALSKNGKKTNVMEVRGLCNSLAKRMPIMLQNYANALDTMKNSKDGELIASAQRAIRLSKGVFCIPKNLTTPEEQSMFWVAYHHQSEFIHSDIQLSKEKYEQEEAKKAAKKAAQKKDTTIQEVEIEDIN